MGHYLFPIAILDSNQDHQKMNDTEIQMIKVFLETNELIFIRTAAKVKKLVSPNIISFFWHNKSSNTDISMDDEI